MADADEFCKEKGLAEYTELFQRAALVARDPHAIESIPELPGEERNALIFEREHPWKLSGKLWYSVILCAVGAA